MIKPIETENLKE